MHALISADKTRACERASVRPAAVRVAGMFRAEDGTGAPQVSPSPFVRAV